LILTSRGIKIDIRNMAAFLIVPEAAGSILAAENGRLYINMAINMAGWAGGRRDAQTDP
jgi:hypothetical protein